MTAGDSRTEPRKKPKAPALDALEAALRHLGRKARSVAEIRRYLRSRRYGPEEIDRAVARLQEMGYLDDRALAAGFTSWASANRPMGRRRMGADLARRGLDRSLIDEVLSGSIDAEDEARALGRALDKVARSIRGPADAKARRRVTNYLLRRGFGGAQVVNAVREWAASVNGGEGEDDGELQGEVDEA